MEATLESHGLACSVAWLVHQGSLAAQGELCGQDELSPQGPGGNITFLLLFPSSGLFRQLESRPMAFNSLGLFHEVL